MGSLLDEIISDGSATRGHSAETAAKYLFPTSKLIRAHRDLELFQCSMLESAGKISRTDRRDDKYSSPSRNACGSKPCETISRTRSAPTSSQRLWSATMSKIGRASCRERV